MIVYRIKVYLAEHDVATGTELNGKLKEAISRCSALIVLVTSRSLDSTIVQHEIGYASGKNKLILPLVLKGTDTSNFGFLHGLEYIELDTADPIGSYVTLTTSLQPFFRNQALGFSVSLNTSDPTTVLLLLGIGVLGGLLIASILAEGE